MKLYKLLFLILILGLSVTAQTQDDFEDEDDIELLEEVDDIPPEPELGDIDPDEQGEAPPQDEPAFKPRSRFNRANTKPAEEPPQAARPSRFNRGNRNSSPSPTPTLQKPVQGKKMSFADAKPEDITNENFPDVVESFDYKDAPLLDVVNAMARLTGKNMILESGLSGKITIIAPNKITIAEAWEAFLSSLAMNGFTIVPSGKFLKIRKIDKAKTDSIETYAGAYYPNGDQLITRILRLKYIQAANVKKSFERVIKSKSGQMVAYEKTNSLIITDLGSSVERISRILSELDKPGFEERLVVIPIRNASAKDLAALIDKIINKGEDKNKRRSFRPSSRFGKKDKDESLSLVSPDERTNSIIVVGNSQGITRIQKLVKQLDYPLDAGEGGKVHVYYVKHGEAKKIEETINGLASEAEKKSSSSKKASSNNNSGGTFVPPQSKPQIFGGDVVIKADENTNSLIITASKQDYKTVLSLLNKIDLPKDQVYVQAYIVEMSASSGDTWEAGIMKFAGAKANGVTPKGDEGLARIGYNFGGATKLLDTGAEGVFLPIGSKKLVDVRFGTSVLQVPDLLGFINFLKTQEDVNVLSTPQVLAMDNEEAVISIGEEVPVGLNQTSTAAGVAPQNSVTFKEANIELKIKPFISPDSDIVRMEIEQKVDNVSERRPQAEGLANISQGLVKRSVKTNLTLKSGDTAVLGGLMQDTDSITESKIPILGDIPVLGWLFKKKEINRRKTNLIVFLNPKIIRRSADHKKMTRTKLNERIDWIKKNAKGRDPFGATLASLVKYADAPDEFQLEDQSIMEVEPALDTESNVEEDFDFDEAIVE